jgi:hypothetical protein
VILDEGTDVGLDEMGHERSSQDKDGEACDPARSEPGVLEVERHLPKEGR